MYSPNLAFTLVFALILTTGGSLASSPEEAKPSSEDLLDYPSDCTREDKAVKRILSKELEDLKEEINATKTKCEKDQLDLQVCLDAYYRQPNVSLAGYECFLGHGWLGFEGVNMKRWDASKRCKDIGGRLPTLNSEDEIKVLTRIMNEKTPGFGLKADEVWVDVFQISGKYVTEDEKPLDPGFELPWEEDQKSEYFRYQGSVLKRNGKLATDKNYHSIYFICQLD